MQRSPVIVYRGSEVGAYGFEDKPWFPPDRRLDAFVAAALARGLDRKVRWIEAPAAPDEALHLFHPPSHVAHVRRRCAENHGALDHGATPARASVERAATHVVENIDRGWGGILETLVETPTRS